MIQEARDKAMAVLKPGKADLEHGLELHADSVVFDAYGFAPRTAMDVDALRAAREEGASAAEIMDRVFQMTMTRCATDPTERAEYEEAWNAAGVTCIFQNAGTSSQSPLQIMKWLANFTYTVDMMPDFFRRAVTPDDIVRAKAEGKHCLYFSSNGVPLTQEWVSVEEELRYISVFFRLGTRMMHLTYNRRNMIGDGCAELANGGLSDFGRAVVKEMNKVGVIVDVAHSGWQTSLEAALASEYPMVASHSACAALNKHCRCLPDDVISAIAETNGYIGICGVHGFLGRSADTNALLDHIDYVSRKFGVEHVAIGMDIAYNMSRVPAEEELEVIPKGRRPGTWSSFWPPHARTQRPRISKRKPPSLAWTNWPLFTVGLVQRGYSDDDIRKIIGGNVLRVARDVLA